MRFFKPLLLFFCLNTLTLLAQTRLKPYEAYIANYAKIAVDQQKRHGVPASITLAQGLLESGAGRSQMALSSNNHFGIKCHNSWTGDTVMHFDDGKMSCFRKYEKPEDSFDDHSMFLVNGRRYASLFQLDVADYKGWAKGLKAAGYATDPAYADKLIRIIETYGLNAFATGKAVPAHKAAAEEQAKAEKVKEREEKSSKLKARLESAKAARTAKNQAKKAARAAKADSLQQIHDLKRAAKRQERKSRQAARDSAARLSGIFNRDDVKHAKDYQALVLKPVAQTINPLSCHEVKYLGTLPYVTAQYGDSFQSISDEFGLTPNQLRKFNECPADYKLTTGEPVYLDAKNEWWEGELPIHVVKSGESMHDIAQMYGLKLTALYRMNDLNPGDAVKVGSKLKLRNPDQMSPVLKAMNQSFNALDSTAVQPAKTAQPIPPGTQKTVQP